MSCPASPPVTNSRVFLEPYRGSNATLCQHNIIMYMEKSGQKNCSKAPLGHIHTLMGRLYLTVVISSV